MSDIDQDYKEKLPEEAGASVLLDDVDNFTRAIVPMTDDPSVPQFSFRVIVLGLFWCILYSIANMILTFRTNPFAIETSVSILLSYPAGNLMAKYLPKGFMNPGPFSVKEHVLISIIASAGGAGAYGMDNVIVQRSKMFMGNENITFIESLCWVMATQFIGFGIAGLTRRFLVKPKAMFFPSCLAQIALYTTLHNPDVNTGSGWKITRFKFFWITFAAIFLYTLIPQFFASVFTVISLVCVVGSIPSIYETKTGKILRGLGSADAYQGVGLGSFTMDWSYITSEPITIPFVYMLNKLFGMVMYGWVLAPIIFYFNLFNTPPLLIAKGPKYFDGEQMPNINANLLFNNKGTRISAVKLFDPTNHFQLNQTAYNLQKPIFLGPMFCLTYFAQFLTLASLVANVALWHGKTIVAQFKSAISQVESESEKDDIHNVLMRSYRDIPEWVFLVFLAICMVGFMITTQLTHFTLPLWGTILGIGLCVVMIIPQGVVLAVTGTFIALNVLAQIIIGLIIPGNTVAVMAFKSLVTNNGLQAQYLISDLKIGHYMKISPYAMFGSQLLGTFVGSICSTIIGWMLITFEDWTSKIGVDPQWQATGYMTFFNAGAIWGAIGPYRFFIGEDSHYSFIFIGGWVIGFLLPFVPYLLSLRFPSPKWKYISLPVVFYFGSAGQVQNLAISQFVVAFVFQYWIFKYYRAWFDKYNYVTAAAISAGSGICVLFANFIGLAVDSEGKQAIQAPVWALNPVTEPDYYCYDGMSYE